MMNNYFQRGISYSNIERNLEEKRGIIGKNGYLCVDVGRNSIAKSSLIDFWIETLHHSSFRLEMYSFHLNELDGWEGFQLPI